MRACPVCENESLHPNAGRTEIFRMGYRIPDGWSLPSEIVWYTCDRCGMIYGDGDMNQAMFDEYYVKYYGYGVNNPANIKRLKQDALSLLRFANDVTVVDFGGAGDDGKSVFIETLKANEFTNAHCVGVGDTLPSDCDIIYASHVMEHLYNLPDTMDSFCEALKSDGLLIIDVPDATGLLTRWKMPILDFNTKHLNHFTLRNLLDLGHRWGFEAVKVVPYELEFAPCYQVHFRRLNVAEASAEHIVENISARLYKLAPITEPVNVWGLSDVAWHLLSRCELDVVNYIDNDPAYRGATYNGKPVLERPDNNAPIVIMSQGQRKRLIENIRKAGVMNPIIEI